MFWRRETPLAFVENLIPDCSSRYDGRDKVVVTAPHHEGTWEQSAPAALPAGKEPPIPTE
jgi:hypothetical protein